LILLEAAKTKPKFRGGKTLETKKNYQGVVADLVTDYANSIEHATHSSRVSPGRVLYLRPSQMPFCPIEFFINHAGKGMYRSMGLAGALYVNMGTVVHSVLQQYLTKSGKILGDYECHECGTMHKLSYKTECCDFPTEYHEIEIDYKGIHGHIDAVYLYKGKLYILDFKTTSIAQAPKKEKDPGVTYREQIETYAYLIELQYGLEIAGVMDAFIIRDNPSKDPVVWFRPFTDAARKSVKTRLLKYKKMHKEALEAKTLKDAMALLQYGRCKNEYCEFCDSWKSDHAVRNKIQEAVRVGTSLGYLPICAMAEKAQAKQDARRKAR
jgi:PD-(D/E)XK nuclease superfamily